ncbi:aminodeoxychorismate synthase [Xylaria venustula]|nr:aminodeoxychorismate synthase [Xylaria venustula]
MGDEKQRLRILFVDAYDSFTNNITALLSSLLHVDVNVIHMNSPLLNPSSPTFQRDLIHEISHYDAVVCGPGPGSPENDADVGIMKRIWELGPEHQVPVLGICLGFQSLALSIGGRARRLVQGMHGMVRDISHRGTGPGADIFTGVKPFKATLYHSLGIDIGQQAVPTSLWPILKWNVPPNTRIQPLAWVEEERDNEEIPERILMALRHTEKPFWGLQYHPESVCTQSEGNTVVKNWFQEALQWNHAHRRSIRRGATLLAGPATKRSLLSTNIQLNDCQLTPPALDTCCKSYKFACEAIQIPDYVQVPDILEILQANEFERIVLDSSSGKARTDPRSRYTIIALDVAKALRLEYHTGAAFATVRAPRDSDANDPVTMTVPLQGDQDIWWFISNFCSQRHLGLNETPCTETPFLGGFMGFVTYEQGLQNIGVSMAANRQKQRADISLAWVTKSVVIDQWKSTLHVHHLCPTHEVQAGWVNGTAQRLQISTLWCRGKPQQNGLDLVKVYDEPTNERPKIPFIIQKPDRSHYEAKVRTCQEYIAAGESYELCLTDATTITRSITPGILRRGSSAADEYSWRLFCNLRRRQPAPFASYIRLGLATLVSASPERFLQYDRDGLCSMRPMKGTVKRSEAVRTLADAEAILHVPKEEAENLMIVDLVRHDLHGVCGPGSVSVPDLLKVEAYESVFQMVTVVEGRLAPGSKYTGLDVLAASLPPGSMTGAPKKRSCEILRKIEGERERSLYSGVVGYMDVTGRGDWSVTIRCAFRWDDDVDEEAREKWHLGAGGAVTILSTPEGETEEMITKLSGTSGSFL